MRGSRSRKIGGGLALALVVALCAEPAAATVESELVESASADASTECPAEAETAAAATGEAISCGEDVLVSDLLTEWSTSYATPTGDLDVEYSTSALRQDSDGDGQWGEVAVDVMTTPTSADADGVPAGMLPVTGGVEPIWLNPGGAGGVDLPLVVMGQGEDRVSMSSASLPVTGAATVDGDRVSYDLGGGVVLVVSVNTEGTVVTPVVQVRDVTALEHLRDDLLVGSDAQTSSLTLSFPIDVAEGFELAPSQAGFEIRESSGSVAYESGPVLMWDSAGGLNWDGVGTTDTSTGAATAARSAGTEPSDSDVGSDDVAGDRLAAPAEGDLIAPMDVSVADDVVTVVPDPGVLTNPDLEFPLHLDPSIGASSPGRWATLRSGWPTTSIYKSDEYQAVGFCDVSRASECDKDSRQRLVWYFTSLRQGSTGPWLSSLSGSDIMKATFRVYGTHSWDCANHTVAVWGTDDFDSTVSWNNQPRWRSEQDSVATSHKIECDNRHTVEFDVTTRAQTAANEDASWLGLGMRAWDESDMTWWKRYRAHNATLSIKYDQPPLPPTRDHVKLEVNGNKLACADWDSRPRIPTTNPTFTAVASDPDKTSSIQLRFRVMLPGTTDVLGTSTWTSPASGSTWGKRTISGMGLKSGTTYSFQVQVKSYDSSSGHTGTTSFSESPWCYFIPDTTYPNPPKVTSSNYPYRQVAGGVGTPIQITVDDNGSTDIAKFEWAYNAQVFPAANNKTPSSGGTASLSIPVTRPGLNYVLLRSRDKAGLVSDVTRYEFYVGFPFASAHWKFNDDGWLANQPRTAVNSETSSTGSLALSSGVTWDHALSEVYPPNNYVGEVPEGRIPNGALVFDEPSDAARAKSRAVDGTESFTVSAFLRADDNSASGAAVSQESTAAEADEDGNTESSFHLGFSSSADCPTEDAVPCWSFWHTLSPDTVRNAISRTPIPVVPGEWAHVVGIYDAGTSAAGDESVQAYACAPTARPMIRPTAGAKASFDSFDPDWTPWSAAGPLRLGSGLRNGSPHWQFKGAIDEVKVYAGAIVGDEALFDICTGADVP